MENVVYETVNKMAVVGILLIALQVIAIVVVSTLWLVALIHCIKHKHDSDRLMWILLICLTGPVGSVLYLTIGKPKAPPPLSGTHNTPARPTPNGPRPAAAKESGPAQPPFDHLAMQDEKKRTQAIIDALSAMSASKRR